MANLVYGRPTDNIAATATAIVGSAPDAAYPAANLVDLNPAKPAKLTTATGNWVFDFGSAKQVDLVALALTGRGDFDAAQWKEAVTLARSRRTGSTADYLLGIPLLGDYL